MQETEATPIKLTKKLAALFRRYDTDMRKNDSVVEHETTKKQTTVPPVAFAVFETAVKAVYAFICPILPSGERSLSSRGKSDGINISPERTASSCPTAGFNRARGMQPTTATVSISWLRQTFITSYLTERLGEAMSERKMEKMTSDEKSYWAILTLIENLTGSPQLRMQTRLQLVQGIVQRVSV